MAERLADIALQIRNARQLDAVVTALRGIAASRAQKGRSLLPGIEAYADVVSRAIGQALNLVPDYVPALFPRPRTKLGLILFCAEHGFAGAFSERVLDSVRNDLGKALILLVGTRGAVVATERGIEPDWSSPMPTHIDAMPGFVNRLADALYGYIAAGRIANAEIVFSRWSTGGGIVVDRHSLLPIDFRRFARPIERQAPLTTLAPRLLIERLAAEYVYAQLYQASMHSFEAENEARMTAMASAKTGIETRLDALAQRERQLRQEEITTEIVELAAGAEALRTTQR